MTRKDVAKRAGVSEATVSHVVNNSKYVSEELALRVRKAIAELDYRPNIIARSLMTKTTKHVAIVVSDIKNPYYAEITEGMQEVAASKGYLVSLLRYGDNNKDAELVDLAYRHIDGVFLATTRINTFDVAKKFIEQGIAVVLDIAVDYSGAIDTMIKYLTELGHRRIAFLSGLSLSGPEDPRYLEFVKGLKKWSVLPDPKLIIDGVVPYYTTINSGYEAMNRLLKAHTDVTAVFALNDLMAIGAMRAVRDAGLKVPGDISVVGCDDIFLADSVDPALTTLRVPKLDMGRNAMYQLIHQIKEKKHESVVVKAEFIIRNSTGIAKKY